MPDPEVEVIASVSPRSVGPMALFAAEAAISAATVRQFASTPEDVRDARRALERAGFHVFEAASSDVTLTIGGPARLFREFFGARLSRRTAEIGAGMSASFMATGDDPAEALLAAPGELAGLIEGAVIARPPIYFAPSPIPPPVPVDPRAYPYLTVPDGVAVMLRAAPVHRLGITGRGVVVAMLDTGHHRHPWFAAHGYRLLPTLLAPGASGAGTDDNGHGTGESANVFAAAPDCRLRMVKMANDAVGALNTALNSVPRPQIITNSWGYDEDRPGTAIPVWLKPLEAAVANAAAQGVVMCFSAGNRQFAFPGSHPDVISVGGVHVNLPDADALEASSFASSFASAWYPGRSSPDLCGLTGREVMIGGRKAPGLLLPVQEGAVLDTIDPQTGAFPDGWGLFSGTSAACPQVAGIAALMLQAEPSLTPAEVRARLMLSARDVMAGATAQGDMAAPGPDRATGAGLADAEAAHLAALGDVPAAFFAAPRAERLARVAAGDVPGIAADRLADLAGRMA